MGKRRIAILGSTGSIGTQALDVIRQHRDLFEVELISAYRSTELLCTQAREFDANNVVICDESLYQNVSDSLRDTNAVLFIFSTHAMLITASSPETATFPSSHPSMASIRNAIPRTIMTFMLLRT